MGKSSSINNELANIEMKLYFIFFALVIGEGKSISNVTEISSQICVGGGINNQGCNLSTCNFWGVVPAH